MTTYRCKKQITNGVCVGCGQAFDAASVYHDYFFEVRVRDWLNEKDIMALNVATKGGTTAHCPHTHDTTPPNTTPHHTISHAANSLRDHDCAQSVCMSHPHLTATSHHTHHTLACFQATPCWA